MVRRVAHRSAEGQEAGTSETPHPENRMNSDRLLITPGKALPHVVLWQSYSVEDVARIASACAGETHQDRIVDALKLLEAVEKIANPMAPWLDQDTVSDDERVMDELRRQTPEIIKRATSETGRIDRMELCRIACEKAGRVGKGEKPLTDDRIEKLFHEWLSGAADSHARWEAFRDLPRTKIARCKPVIQAHNDSIAAQKNCDSLAACWQALREKKKAAISNGLTEKEIAEIETHCDEAEALFRASKDAAWEAERRITRSLNEAYVREVDRKRKNLTEEQKKAEREAFRLRFEAGTGNAKRSVREKQRNISVDPCGTIHTFVRLTPRELKPHLTIHGNPVAICDIESAHMCVLPCLIQERIDWLAKRGKRTEGLESERQHLISLLASTDIYNHLAEGSDRSKFKKSLLSSINMPTAKAFHVEAYQRFRRAFPLAVGIIEDIKTKGHHGISRPLQHHTARIITHAMAGTQKSGIPCIPDTDALIVPASAKDTVSEILNRSLFQVTGVNRI
jgi:hypothetical protein